MKDLAPDIFRQRLLVEGFYRIDVNEGVIKKYFEKLTEELGLRVYGEPTIHVTSGQGKEANQGYDAFVPLIDSGIYLGVWANKKFISAVIYTCKSFENKKAIKVTQEFWKIDEIASKAF
ncbi:MAG: S-adenosylmethionine decarboxylase [Nanoarchaeota archaeon]